MKHKHRHHGKLKRRKEVIILDQDLKDKVDALIAASQAVQTQQAAILEALEAIKNPAEPVNAFTQEEADAVIAANEEFKTAVNALVTPAV